MRVKNGDSEKTLARLEEFVLRLLPSIELALGSNGDIEQSDNAAFRIATSEGS
jgi:hypothetical protein